MYTVSHCSFRCLVAFFFNEPATTEIYTNVHTLSLHDALPTSARLRSTATFSGAKPSSLASSASVMPARTRRCSPLIWVDTVPSTCNALSCQITCLDLARHEGLKITAHIGADTPRSQPTGGLP